MLSWGWKFDLGPHHFVYTQHMLWMSSAWGFLFLHSVYSNTLVFWKYYGGTLRPCVSLSSDTIFFMHNLPWSHIIIGIIGSFIVLSPHLISKWVVD